MGAKKNLKKLLPFLLIILGLALVAYPYISEYLFEHRVASEMHIYQGFVQNMDNQRYTQMLSDAHAYNTVLKESQIQLSDPFIKKANQADDIQYEKLLSADDSGIMGYIDIPAIDVYLPIYHGTSVTGLERGVGHLEGTSLPVGGEGTHSVITGHTGLNRAKLFTDLSELKEEDLFFLHILGETFAYKIYDISIVLPEDTSELMIQKESDIVTLITCTPYGVNSHRLLVHGERIPYEEEEHQQALQNKPRHVESQWLVSYKKAMWMGMVIVLCIFIICSSKKAKIWGIVFISAGFMVLFSPNFMQYHQASQMKAMMKAYDEKYKMDDAEHIDNHSKIQSALYDEIALYNQRIYEEGQVEFKDPWAYEQIPVELASLQDEMFGYIEIPAMNQSFPLYIGATSQHMSEGAAIMGNTSIPVGGINTNSVIAGHRGYNRNKTFFKDIEDIQIGDKIYITNPWGRLTYIVSNIDVIEPDNVDAIKIQEGRDMITLLTCHPYASHGRYRYLVYCSRYSEQEESRELNHVRSAIQNRTSVNHIVASDGTVYQSSLNEIHREKLFRAGCIGLLSIIFFLSIIIKILKGQKYRQENGEGEMM